MDPIRPTPVRPYRAKRDKDGRGGAEPSPSLKQNKSFADLASLSRSSSFLNFTGLEALKSSALFGIFERSGLDTEPQTPDPQQHYDFHLSSPPVPPNPQTAHLSVVMAVTKLASVVLASLAFILLFNRIPNNNHFCLISSEQPIHPLVYVLLATSTAVLFPVLDAIVDTLLPSAISISEPVSKDTRVSSRARRGSPSQDKAGSAWSFNILIRYFAGFLGLAYAGTKLDFSQSSQFNLCVSAISLAVLLILDRTLHGLLLSIGLTLVVSAGFLLFQHTPNEDWLGVANLIWLNVSFYGSLGKRLKLWSRL